MQDMQLFLDTRIFLGHKSSLIFMSGLTNTEILKPRLFQDSLVKLFHTVLILNNRLCESKGPLCERNAPLESSGYLLDTFTQKGPALLKVEHNQVDNLAQVMHILKGARENQFVVPKSNGDVKQAFSNKHNNPTQIVSKIGQNILEDSDLSRLLVDAYVLILSDHINATILFCSSGDSFCFHQSSEEKLRSISLRYSQQPNESDSEGMNIFQTVALSTLIPLDTTGQSFFMCYHKPVVTLQFYLDPFQTSCG